MKGSKPSKDERRKLMFESFSVNSEEAAAQMRELDAKAHWLLAINLMHEIGVEEIQSLETPANTANELAPSVKTEVWNLVNLTESSEYRPGGDQAEIVGYFGKHAEISKPLPITPMKITWSSWSPVESLPLETETQLKKARLKKSSTFSWVSPVLEKIEGLSGKIEMIVTKIKSGDRQSARIQARLGRDDRKQIAKNLAVSISIVRHLRKKTLHPAPITIDLPSCTGFTELKTFEDNESWEISVIAPYKHDK